MNNHEILMQEVYQQTKIIIMSCISGNSETKIHLALY